MERIVIVLKALAQTIKIHNMAAFDRTTGMRIKTPDYSSKELKQVKAKQTIAQKATVTKADPYRDNQKGKPQPGFIEKVKNVFRKSNKYDRLNNKVR